MLGYRYQSDNERQHAEDCHLKSEVVVVGHSDPSSGPIGAYDVAQAGAAAVRATGFSTIGMLMSPEKIPSAIDSHHTGS